MDDRILSTHVQVAAFLFLALDAAPARAVSSSDVTKRDLDATGSTIGRRPADSRIEAALSRISAARIQRTVEPSVRFHTRNTLSSMETDPPKGQGVSAAADWIETELKRYSPECGSCLEVKRDTFPEPPPTGPHAQIVRSTTITDVHARFAEQNPANLRQ